MPHCSRRLCAGCAAACIVAALAASASHAHVPYLEADDYSPGAPFVVRDVAQSKALYGWLDRGDVDYYAMALEEPASIYTHSLVPECREYLGFRVTYAIIGPGLPRPEHALPFSIDGDEGAIIVSDPDSPGPRPTTYEMFSARSYFRGPDHRHDASRPGTYRVAVWNESGASGDYVLVIGDEERFDAEDFERAARYTEVIREGRELKGSCTAP